MDVERTDMFIPINTDAPIYHFPFATIGLIVVNSICFATTGFGDHERLEPWLLQFGHIDPVEWLSSMFSHAGFFHLIGNMIFLWGFGLVVEGKLGWRRMLTLYFAIGLIQAAFTQGVMIMSREGSALGASSAIMGLMAISLVWAPKNEMHLVGVLPGFYGIPRFFSFDVTIMSYAIWLVGWDLLFFLLFPGMGTPALHLSGALIGFAVGVLYVKRKWVDCENWDLFAVLKGTYGRHADPTTAVGAHADPKLLFGKDLDLTSAALPSEADDPARHVGTKALQRINELIDSGEAMTASEELFSLRMRDSESRLDQARLKRLCRGLLDSNVTDEAEVFLEEYIERFPEEASWARFYLARILLTLRQQPRAALQVLRKVRLSQLTQDQQGTAKKIVSTAKRQIREGVQDAEPEW